MKKFLLLLSVILPIYTYADSITLRFDYPEIALPEVNRFRIYYGGAGLGYTNSVTVYKTNYPIASTTFDVGVSNLLGGRMYSFYAVAVAANGGESPQSNEVTYSSKPTAPTNLRVLGN